MSQIEKFEISYWFCIILKSYLDSGCKRENMSLSTEFLYALRDHF